MTDTQIETKTGDLPKRLSRNLSPSGVQIDGVIGNSPAMHDVYRLVHLSAASSAPVLILGESGTGKNLIASLIHELSPRSDGRFLKLCCSGLTEDSFELAISNLVLEGDADQGLGSTLFLDEIDSLELEVQVKLLTLLNEGRIERLEDHVSARVNLRIVAATSQDLNQAVMDGLFREELYWKLSVLPIVLPPLRRRDGDVELLIRHFLSVYSSNLANPVTSIHPTALKALLDYNWPGNIHELQNYLQRAVYWGNGSELTIDSLPATIVGDSTASQSVVFRPADEQSLIREFVYNRIQKSAADDRNLHQRVVEPVERELFLQVMEACQQTQTKAAQWLGINRNTLYKKLVELGLVKTNKEEETKR